MASPNSLSIQYSLGLNSTHYIKPVCCAQINGKLILSGCTIMLHICGLCNQIKLEDMLKTILVVQWPVTTINWYLQDIHSVLRYILFE